MRKWFISYIFLSTLCIGYLMYHHLAPGNKLVYVDSVRLLSKYKGIESIKGNLNERSTLWQANIDTLTKEFQEAVMKYQQQVANLSEKEKADFEKMLAHKQEQLENYKQTISGKAAKEDREMTTQMLTEIDTFIKDYGKQKGYKIILAATITGNIAYAEDKMDITDEVVEELNARYISN